MPAGNNRINFQIGYTVDKAGLEQMQSLFQQIANRAKEPGNRLKEGLQQAGKTAEELDRILEKTFNTELGTLNVTKFNQELSKSGLNIKQIKTDLAQAGGQGSIAYNRLAQSILHTNQQLVQSNKLLDDMADTFTKTVKWGIASSVFNNITNSIQKAYDFTKNLDTSLNDIRIVTDKSAESMERFAQQAQEAAKGMGASTLDYTNAALIYYQQGLTDAEVQARAETTLKAANVTGQRGEEVSEQLTAVWNGYKVTAEETELYVDKLAAVAATTAADLEELSTGMSKVASAANAMGVDFDDLNAQLATIVSVTRQAPESVGTALKTIYARLGDLKTDGTDEFGVSLGEVSSQLSSMGIQILDTNGDLRDMTTVMAEVAEKWQGWTAAQRQAAAVAMAGKRQYNNLIALFENWDMYTDALKTSADAMGTLQHQQDIYMESTEAKLQRLRTTWQGVYDDLFETDEVNTMIDALTDVVQVLDNFVSSFGGGLKTVTGFGAIIASIFNKQIIKNINEANARQQVFVHNLNLAKLSAETRSAGVAQADNTARPEQIANQKSAEIEFEYAKKIYDLRRGLTQEQYQNLTIKQKELGEAEKELSLISQSVDKIGDKLIKEKAFGAETEKIVESLKAHNTVQAAFGDLLDKNNKKIAEREALIENIEKLEKNIRDYTKDDSKNNPKAQNNKRVTTITDNAAKIRQALIKAQDKEGETLYSKTSDVFKVMIKDLQEPKKILEDYQGSLKRFLEILKTSKSLLSENKKEIEGMELSAEELEQAMYGVYEAELKRNSIKMDMDDTLDFAEKASHMADNITGVTSALGNMAMAWSSLSSIVDITMDDQLSGMDKLLQSATTLGMAIPMLMNSYKQLFEVIGVGVPLQEAINARNEAAIAITHSKMASQAAEKGATEAATISQELYNLAVEKGIIVDGEVITADHLKQLADLLAADATTKHAMAQELLNQTLLKNPIFLVITGLTVLAGAIAAVVRIQQKQIEQQIELNNESISRENQIQDEINANEDLYNSYNKIYQQYKQGKVTKEELRKAGEQLCEGYETESMYLNRLKGDYDALAESARAARQQELDRARSSAQREKISTGDNLVQQQKKSIDLGSSLSPMFTGEVAIAYDFKSTTDLGNDPDAIAAQYDRAVKMVEDLNKKKEEGIALTSDEQSAYEQGTEYISQMSESIDAYKASIEDIKNYNTQDIFLNNNLEGISSYQEYSTTVQNIREKLLQLYDGDAQKVSEILTTYIEGIDNEFVQIGYGLDILRKQVHMTDEEFAKLQQWSDGDKQLLLSGKVDFDGLETEQALKEALNQAKNSLSEEDLTIVASLRSKVVSDKKLSKSDLKEMAGEESSLMQDYETEFSDFDNSSELEQVDILNQITADKIQKNNEYIQNTEEVARAEQDLNNQRIEFYKQEKERLGNKAQYIELTDEEKQAYEEACDSIEKYALRNQELNDIIENGLGFDEIDNTIFDGLITGIDGVIDKANVLKDLAELVGENWTIAADDIQELVFTFPELVQAQENYNTLQDGSIQLTEQGKQALQGLVEQRKAEIAAENEAYQIELQKQADLQYAAADYYHAQAENIKQFLDGKINADEAERKADEALRDYQNKAIEITAGNDQKAKQAMTNNLAKVTSDAETNLKSQYDYWCSVGQAIAAAAQAEVSGQFTPPGFNGGGSVSSSMEEFTGTVLPKGESIFDNVSAAKAALKGLEAAEKEARNKGDTYLSKKMAAQAQTQSALNAMNNAASGIGGKGSKSKSGKGGGSKKEKEDKEFIEDEIDVLHSLEKQLESLERQVERLDKAREHLKGKDLRASLKQENKLLNQQIHAYKELIKGEEKQAGIEKGKLKKANIGIKFDKNNNITNYAETQQKIEDQYNAAIRKYNKSAKAEADEKILEAAKTQHDNLLKSMEAYEDHVKKAEDYRDDREEARSKKRENNLKSWETRFQIKFDKRQAQREWNSLKKTMNTDIQKVFKDYSLEAKNAVQDVRTYTNEKGSGTFDLTLKQIREVEDEIDKLNIKGKSSMFDNVDQAQTRLEELWKDLQSHTEEINQLWQDTWSAYLDNIDQAADKFQTLQDEFDRLTDTLEYQAQVIELVYGEKSYEKLGNVYQDQYNTTIGQIKNLKTESETWMNLLKDRLEKNGHTMDDMFSWDEDELRFYNNWMSAQDKINDKNLQALQISKQIYQNSINENMDQLERSLLNGSTLEEVEYEWERIRKEQEKYYDSAEKTYQIQTLANKMDKEINATNNLKAQQRLLKIRNQEIELLREKDKLTEYDIKKADLRYQLELKQMALEDARNNKTSMKLTRNEQGNWSYQYVANEDDVASKQQELLDVWNELYQLEDEYYVKAKEDMISTTKEYLESVRQIEEARMNNLISEEEKVRKLAQLQQDYTSDMKELASEEAAHRDGLQIASMGLTAQAVAFDKTAYEGLTEAEKAMVEGLKNANVDTYEDYKVIVEGKFDKFLENKKEHYKAEAKEAGLTEKEIQGYVEKRMGETITALGDIKTASDTTMRETRDDWNDKTTEMSNMWNGNSDSVKNQIDQAYTDMDNADFTFRNQVEDTANASGQNFDEFGTHVGWATDDINWLTTQTSLLADETQSSTTAMQGYVDQVRRAWDLVKDAVFNAHKEFKDYVEDAKETGNLETIHKIKIVYETEGEPPDTTPKKSKGGNGSGGSGGDTGTGSPTRKTGDDSTPPAEDKKYYIFRVDKGKNAFAYEAHKYVIKDNMSASEAQAYWDQHRYSQWNANKDRAYDYYKVYHGQNAGGGRSYDTGGYTGAWGDSGKLAVLHEKELVLNKADTENFLSGINMIRDMSSLNGSISNAILKAMANTALSLNSLKPGTISGGTANSNTDNVFNITAEFPNAENVNDIREAILSLPNIASQYANQHKL